MEIPYPPVYATSIADATLVGFRTLLKDDHFLMDEVASAPAAAARHVERLDSLDEHRNERTGLRRVAGSNTFQLDERQEAPIHIEQPVILLSSDEPENYGSFLFRVLPKLAFSRLLARKFKLLVSVPHELMSRLLEICGVDLSNVIFHNTKKVYRLDRVIAPSVRNPHAFLDEVTIGLFSELRTKIAPDSANKRDLIFVSRRNLGSTKAGYRAMENEAEIRLCLEQLGFRTICPETMSADEQIKTFASAAVVVGQSGGAMFNVAFCRPGTIVIDIESEPHWIYAHMSYFSSRNLRYVTREGKPTHGTIGIFICRSGERRVLRRFSRRYWLTIFNSPGEDRRPRDDRVLTPLNPDGDTFGVRSPDRFQRGTCRQPRAFENSDEGGTET